VLRRLVLVLVCLGLALQGAVARTLAAQPCPMEATMQSMVAAGELGEAQLPDCCNDLQTFATTGKPCKTGHDASPTPTLGLAPAPGCVVAAPASATPPAVLRASPPAPVSLPWRPPAPR
jgi:hypothetical protein